MLVGDRDRDLAAAALRRHFVHGRLTTTQLADRVDLTLRARSRRELDTALAGLPMVWEDLPAGIHDTARRVRGGVRRARFLFVLVRAWSKVNLGLVAALGIALLVGAPVGTTVGAVVAAWALATIAFWRVWRSRP